ncbi:MAG: rubredoxin [Nitrososphaerota archaeon]|nr:rubredoxin [Nitrososphaerota archaeon]
MQKFKCSICGYVYDEAIGIPEKGIAPGTKWADVPSDFVCPICTAPKSVFKPFEEAGSTQTSVITADHIELSLKELSAGEISAICSNLAKGCEKQRLIDEMNAFNKIANYYKSKAVVGNGAILTDVVKMLDDDLSKKFSAANIVAKTAADRGALRSLVWSEKVSTMMKLFLDRFAKEGVDMLENTKIYVCDICGFIHIGDAPPAICPVCKVPNFKIIQVERR